MPRKKIMSHPEILKTDMDLQEAARAINLVYVTNYTEGIERIKNGKGYVYRLGNRKITDKLVLDRIKKLAIPPSWSKVWICVSPNGHIQATGLDLQNRKQYRYHSEWNNLRHETKFHRLYEFGRSLHKLRQKVSKDLGAGVLTENKVLATAIELMDKTYIRVGNTAYSKTNGSYGLTTLKDNHVKIKRDNLLLSFIGKKGIEHSISLKSKRLARLIKQCRDIPGKTLFQYYDGDGNKKPIDSGMVNRYIKDATGVGFSAKDFRTWAGSLQAIEYCLSGKNEAEEDGHKLSLAMLDRVSEKLGNSRNICKKYYVLPQLLELCEKNLLLPALKEVQNKPASRSLSTNENILLNILKKYV
jgi:DNA topoisomerase-1